MGELKNIWKKVFVARFEILSLHLHGGTEENYKTLLGCRMSFLGFRPGKNRMQVRSISAAHSLIQHDSFKGIVLYIIFFRIFNLQLPLWTRRSMILHVVYVLLITG
jgi:hypothetical protein